MVLSFDSPSRLIQGVIVADWASQLATVVKNPHLPMQEMEEWRVQSLGQEDPAGGGQGKATHSSVLTWRILWTEELVGYIVHGVTRSWT